MFNDQMVPETVARIGPFLTELERLERAQEPGIFITNRIEATPHAVLLHLPSGETTEVSLTAKAPTIAGIVRSEVPGLQIPTPETEFPWSVEPDVQTQWARLHYALGAHENSMLAEFDVRILDLQRHGSSATVRVVRGPHGTVESYSVDLDREIDLGLTDTLAFAEANGRVGGSLNDD